MSGIVGHLAFGANRSGVCGEIPAFSSYGTNYSGSNQMTKVIEASFYYNHLGCQASGRFTVPLPGIYKFHFHGLIYNVGEGEVGSMQYRVNGSASVPPSGQSVQSGTTAGNHYERSGTYVNIFNPGDYIELWAAFPAGQAYAGQWNMSGTMMHPA